MLCIETAGLSYRYPGDTAGAMALDDIGLAAPEGSIYGFLGPNGAGKTTTLRLLLGLIEPQAGTISILGERFDAGRRVQILRRVGSLIETPSVYEHLSAAENLALLQRIHRVPRERIGEALRLVGLGGTGSKRAGRFSLGMKQRLGIAAAILHRPSLLILDEPSNGLDPNGMLEMRDLLLNLNREEGTTILVSSHLLAEVERLATHVGIVHHGRLLFQGTLAALRDTHEGDGAAVRLHTADDAHALRALALAGVAAQLTPDAGLTLPPMPPPRIAAINRHLVEQGVAVHAIGRTGGDLEAIFMTLIGSRAAA